MSIGRKRNSEVFKIEAIKQVLSVVIIVFIVSIYLVISTHSLYALIKKYGSDSFNTKEKPEFQVYSVGRKITAAIYAPHRAVSMTAERYPTHGIPVRPRIHRSGCPPGRLSFPRGGHASCIQEYNIIGNAGLVGTLTV